MRKLALLVTIFVLLILVTITASAQAGGASIRFGHFAANAPDVDVFINGQSRGSLKGLAFGEMTNWLVLPIGTHTIEVKAAGREATFYSTEWEAVADTSTTIAATGNIQSVEMGIQVIEEDTSEVLAGEARVTILHAIDDLGIVDLVNNGEVLRGRMAYPGTITLIGGEETNDGVTILNLRAKTYNNLVLVPNGQSGPILLDLSGTTLDEGVSYFVAPIGTADDPQLFVQAG